MVVVAVALAVVVPRVRVRMGSLNKSVRLRALPVILEDPSFRIAVLFGSSASRARVVAIERHTAKTRHRSLHPSFCHTEVDRNRGSATMYIGGRAVIPSSELVVFMADYGADPVRVVIARDDYDKIAMGGVSPMWSDILLWDLCQRDAAE